MPRIKDERLTKVTFYLLKEQMVWLQILSKRDDRSVTAHIRRAIDRYIKEMRGMEKE